MQQKIATKVFPCKIHVLMYSFLCTVNYNANLHLMILWNTTKYKIQNTKALKSYMNSISTLWIANNGNPAIMSNALMRPKEYTITLQKREKDEEERNKITFHLRGGSLG